MKRYLIDENDIGQQARACYADPEIARRFIDEAEFLDVRPTIGDALLMALRQTLEGGTFDATFDATFGGAPADARLSRLLDGCEYTDRCGHLRIFRGLRIAECYYAYARIVRGASSLQTRFGFVHKSEEYSDLAEVRQRAAAYNEAFKTADTYMAEVRMFLENNAGEYPEWNCGRVIKNNRLRVRRIGH